MAKAAKESVLGVRSDDPADMPEWAANGTQDLDVTDGARQQLATRAGRQPTGSHVDATETVHGTVVTGTPAMDNLLSWLVAMASERDEDDMSGLESIVREVLQADNIADVLTQRLPVSASAFAGQNILINGFSIRESDYDGDGSLPFYASMNVMAGNPPEVRVINVGAIKILAQLKRLYEIDEWPVMATITEGKAKKGKEAPLSLSLVS